VSITQAITYPRDCFDQRRIAELHPESSDMHVERARVAVIIHAPHAIKQHFSGRYAPRVTGQFQQQSEFLAREPHLLAVTFNAEACRINDQYSAVVYRMRGVYKRDITSP
jgi:hypothetical protein